MTPLLEQRFSNELSVLAELFGDAEVQERLSRLNELFAHAEAEWRKYIAQIPKGRVKYLLIAEAPPWIPRGAQPQYVLDPSSRSRTLMRALRKAFLLASAYEQFTAADSLAEFARQGFLIVDSIPFAMKYSSSIRRSGSYQELVGLSVRNYLQNTLKQSSLSWSSDILVAFSVKLNALAVMNGLGAELDLGGRHVTLSRELIAVNGAGYPDGDKLSELFRLAVRAGS